MRHRPAGFMVIDALFGMAMLVALATTLLVTVNRQQLASRRLASSRTALALAEQVMANLQSGHPAEAMAVSARTPDDSPVTVAVESLTVDPLDSRRMWVEVRVSYRQRQATLTGLVPADVKRQMNRAEYGDVWAVTGEAAP